MARDVGAKRRMCRREGISANLYYGWSKEFLEAGKKRLLGDTKREASHPQPMRAGTATTMALAKTCPARSRL